jgi:hypothetical protein
MRNACRIYVENLLLAQLTRTLRYVVELVAELVFGNVTAGVGQLLSNESGREVGLTEPLVVEQFCVGAHGLTAVSLFDGALLAS